MYKFSFNNLDIVAISDTHGGHSDIDVPICDVLIHAGDVCDFGDIDQLEHFMVWFSEQPARYKIFVSGNHDTMFEQRAEHLRALIPSEVLYLECSVVDIEGVSFASVPARGELLCSVALENVDIMITHGAPYGVFDEGIGCPYLSEQIKVSKPKYALFGHIHFAKPQQITIDGTTFVNLTEMKF